MRFFKFFVAVVIVLGFISGCKKDSTTYDTTPNFYFINGGTTYFDQNLILFSSADTVTVNLIISSTYIKSKETIITFGAADTYRTSYNAANGTSYEAMPAASYSFATSITSAVNTGYDTLPVTINKQLLAGKDYLLPIKITSVNNNYKIDSASSVIYLHTQSSKLAGKYTSSGQRDMYNGDSSDNNISSTDSFTINKNLVPLSADSSEIDYANLGVNGWKYIMGFSANNTFYVLPNDVIKSAVQPGSFMILESSFDAATGNIYVKSRYKNLNGDYRIVEESLTLQ